MDELSQQLPPFITRDLLRFGKNASIQLRLTSQTNNTTSLFVRGITREGMFEFRAIQDGTGAGNVSNFRIPDIPIFVSVVDDSNGNFQGDAYVNLELLINGEIVLSLLSGFVYINKSLSWPQTTNFDMRPGGGRLGWRSGTNPAANVEITELVPESRIWRLIACTFTLVTDANVANRRVHFEMHDSSGQLVEAFSSVDQTASQTILYSVGHFGNTPDETDNNVILINIPDNVYLQTDGQFNTATLNRQATDNFSAPFFLVEEFFISG